MAIKQKYFLDLVPNRTEVFVPISQYDSQSRIIEFEIENEGMPFEIPSGTLVTVRGTKNDNTGFVYNCSYTSNYVSMVIEEQMSIFSGKIPCELRLTQGNQILGTANFILYVEPTTLKDDVVISETDLPLLEEAIQASEKAQDSAEQAQESAESASQAVANGLNDVYETNAVKNLLKIPYSYDSRTINGITWTVNDDGTITADGTATGASDFYIKYYFRDGSEIEKDDCIDRNIILSGCPSGGSGTTYYLHYANYNGTNSVNDYGNGTNSFTPKESSSNKVIMARIRSGVTVNNLVFKPMIRLASAPSGYVQYAKNNVELTNNLKVVQYSPLDVITLSDNFDLYDSYGLILKSGSVVQFGVTFKNTVLLSPGSSQQIIGTITDSSLIPIKSSQVISQGSASNIFLAEILNNGIIRVSRYRSGSTMSDFAIGTWINIYMTYIVGE